MFEIYYPNMDEWIGCYHFLCDTLEEAKEALEHQMEVERHYGYEVKGRIVPSPV